MSALLTDERLRTWLDGNQPQRERLCLALLALDRRYTQITPRRPRGGRDNGRDLEAVFRNETIAWGAVGFRNMAKDSPADKRWVRMKFLSDLESARRANPTLAHFVFFTNVDLTSKEVSGLQAKASSLGVFCNVLYRERIRILLDSVDGLALRYQYLEIQLSQAEQATFFARFGDALQGMLAQRFDALDQKLARIEFQSECLRPTRYCSLSMQMKRPFELKRMDGLGVLLVAVSEDLPSPHPTLCLAASAVRANSALSSEVAIWSGAPLRRVISGGQAEWFMNRHEFSFGLPAESINSFLRVSDFDRLWLHLYATQVALDIVESISFVVNGYAVARSSLDSLFFDPAKADDAYLATCFGIARHHDFLENVDGPKIGTPLPPLAYTDFSAHPPVRLDERGDVQL